MPKEARSDGHPTPSISINSLICSVNVRKISKSFSRVVMVQWIRHVFGVREPGSNIFS